MPDPAWDYYEIWQEVENVNSLAQRLKTLLSEQEEASNDADLTMHKILREMEEAISAIKELSPFRTDLISGNDEELPLYDPKDLIA